MHAPRPPSFLAALLFLATLSHFLLLFLLLLASQCFQYPGATIII